MTARSHTRLNRKRKIKLAALKRRHHAKAAAEAARTPRRNR